MLELYNKDLKRIAFLQNAYDIQRESVFTGVGGLSFKIPKDDPKTLLCDFNCFVRYASRETGLLKYSDYYRIAEKPSDEDNGDSPTVEYYCEHGIITLIDKLMFGSYTVGGLGYYTRQVMEFVLNKQDPIYWRLGECDFDRQFEYNWSQENLLAALFSIPNNFASEYMFKYDMSVFPWKVSLKKFNANAPPTYYIRKRTNQLSVKKSADAKQLMTRIYPLGYGEGNNQLTIRSVNGGVLYLQAPKVITDKYGIVERAFVDRRFTSAQSLKDRAQALLNEYMQPYQEYDLSVSDLFTSKGMVEYLPNAGEVVDVPAEKLRAYITNVTTALDRPGKVKITIANKPRDAATSISNLADRQRIEQVYAQGATNIFSYSFRDNANATNPLKESFFIPAESVKINFVMLKFELRNFRAYETGAEAGGAQSSTSSAGGSDEVTSSYQGSTLKTTSTSEEQQDTSESGGGEVVTSESVVLEAINMWDEGLNGEGYAKHNHGIVSSEESGLRIALTDWNQTSILGSAAWVPSGAHTHGAHGHKLNVSPHSHRYKVKAHAHSLQIDGHSHKVTIKAHSHQFETKNHTHAPIYGIYEGGKANSVTLKVDGRSVPLAQGATEVNIAPYLSVDSSGKINRGTYHEVELIPDALTGILGSITVQLFIQSQGGGDY